jgi:dTDP-4-dehydrorhamnose 3,5-epimerase
VVNLPPFEGVHIQKLRVKSLDERGWLCEMFRFDEAPFNEPFNRFDIAMAYVSLTYPNQIRGPHEHIEQTDMFVFMGPGIFKLSLWDNRKLQPTYKQRFDMSVGRYNPVRVIVPPGVVHAYQNTDDTNGLVYNFPDKLYMGFNRSLPIDEIRYENSTEFRF